MKWEDDIVRTMLPHYMRNNKHKLLNTCLVFNYSQYKYDELKVAHSDRLEKGFAIGYSESQFLTMSKSAPAKGQTNKFNTLHWWDKGETKVRQQWDKRRDKRREAGAGAAAARTCSCDPPQLNIHALTGRKKKSRFGVKKDSPPQPPIYGRMPYRCARCLPLWRNWH